RLAEFADSLRANVEAMPHIGAWRAGLAKLYTETERLEEARDQIELLRVADFHHPLNWAWTSYMVAASEAVCDLRDTPAADALSERMRPVAGQVQLFIVLASGCSYAFWCGGLAACLHRWDDAERHFTDALATNERFGARPWVVRTRRAWAAMLLDRNAPGD